MLLWLFLTFNAKTNEQRFDSLLLLPHTLKVQSVVSNAKDMGILVFLFPQNSICILLSVNFVSSAEVVVIFQLGFVVIAIEKGGDFYGKMVAFFVAERTL